jgi:tyrosine-protein kinase Etk/Wzc
MSGELEPLRRPGASIHPAAQPLTDDPGGRWDPSPRTGEDEVDLREAWAILRRNWWVVAGCTLLGLIVALAWINLVTPVYRSSTTLQFQEKGSTVPVLDALRDLQAGTEVGTEMEVLRSRSLAEAVIDSLGLQVLVVGPGDLRRAAVLQVVQADADAPEGRVRLVRGGDGRFIARQLKGGADGESGAAAPGKPLRVPGATVVLAAGTAGLDRIDLEVLPRTVAAERFGEALGVSRPNRDANVVQVRFDAADPELARDVANVLVHKYLVRRNVVRKVGDRSTVEFLRAQVDTLQVQLRSAEEAVRRFREANRVVSLEAEAQAQVERLAALQAQRAELEAERGALASLLDETRASSPAGGLSPFRQLLAFPSLLRSQTTSTLLEALTRQESQLAELRARRTPADPDVQAMSSQLRSMEEQAAAVVTTYLGGLESQVEAIDRELAGFGRRLAQVPAREVEYARLERNARVLADIYTLLQTRLKEAEVVEAVEDASVRVVDVAVLAREPTSPRPGLASGAGVLLGAMLGIALAFARSVSDTALRGREEVTRGTGLPVIGMIPAFPHAWRLARHRDLPSPMEQESALSQLPVLRDPGSGVGEAFRALRTNLSFIRLAEPPRVLALTSALPSDGKTTTAVNYAVVAAQQGRRVVVVDADLRRGRLHEALGVARAPGLSELLVGQASLSQALRPATVAPGVSLAALAAGTPPPNPSELLGSDAFRRVIAELAGEADLVLIDCPPLNLVTDAALVGLASDGVVLVARAGRTDRTALRLAAEQLRTLGVQVLGVVLNDVRVGRAAAAYARSYAAPGFHK